MRPLEDHKHKTYNDIKVSFVEKKTKHKKDFDKVREDMRTELLAYYKTPEGRAEIDNSPHYDKSTEEAVDLLMRDVDAWIKIEKGVKPEAVAQETTPSDLLSTIAQGNQANKDKIK